MHADGFDIYSEALGILPYEPLDKQDELLRLLSGFCASREQSEVFVVQGYAGTGKTSLIAALVQALKKLSVNCVMLAPTGRAAKVMARYSGMPAYTIHKRLYRGNSTDPCNTSFYLAPNRDKDTIFIVDEASMIPGSATSRLLDHLVRHVYSSPGCAIIFVGDTAQLPPVGESESEAMSPGRLEQYGLRPYCFELDEPLRQAARSGILYNATRIRRRMTRSPLPLPQLWQKGFADVKVSTSEYLSEQIADSYRHTGQEHTIVITRSNWRAGIINRAIRGTVLYAESCLQRGERLVVARNNYFWTTKVKGAQFIANGESAVVQRIVSREERYGHRWADVELLLPDTKVELTAKLLLTTLETDTPTLGGDELNRLYQAVLKEKKAEGINGANELKVLRTDPYLNALQAKYGYCLTCHKAHGGQWEHVYVDLGGIPQEALATPDFYRWLYTALTRASDKLFLINPAIEIL